METIVSSLMCPFKTVVISRIDLQRTNSSLSVASLKLDLDVMVSSKTVELDSSELFKNCGVSLIRLEYNQTEIRVEYNQTKNQSRI